MNNLFQDTQSSGRDLKSRTHKYGTVRTTVFINCNYIMGMNRRSWSYNMTKHRTTSNV